eukprot:8102266-Pyramimonas_sp.AAC.1
MNETREQTNCTQIKRLAPSSLGLRHLANPNLFNPMLNTNMLDCRRFCKHAFALRARLHYEGTNRWEVMYPVRYTEWKDSWHLNYEEKLTFFGSHRHEVGGSSGIVVPKRNPKDSEPVFYHSPESKMFDELNSGLDLM